MDLSKMYRDISAMSSLDSRVLQVFVQQNDVFVETLKADMESLNPYEAVDTLSFLLYARPYFPVANEWEELAVRCLELVRDGIYQQMFWGVYAYSGLSYICFLARELADKVPVLSRFRDSLEQLLADTLQSYLDTAHKNRFESANTFELIYGFSGVLRCCSDGAPDSPCQALVDEVADALVRRLRPNTKI